MGENKFQVLMSGMLDQDTTISNINKGINTIQKSLKGLNINLELGNIESQLVGISSKISKAMTTSINKNPMSNYQKALEDTIHQYKVGVLDLETYSKRMQNIIFGKDSSSYKKDFLNLSDKSQEKYINALTSAYNQQVKSLQEVHNVNKQIETEDQKRLNALNSQSIAIQKMQQAFNNQNTKYSGSVNQNDKDTIQTQIDALSRLNPLTDEYTRAKNQAALAVGTYNKVLRETATNEDKEIVALAKKDSVINGLKNKLNELTNSYGSYVDATKLSQVNGMITSLQGMKAGTAEYNAQLIKTQDVTRQLGSESKQAFKRLQDGISDTTAKSTMMGVALRQVMSLFLVGSPIFLARRAFLDMAESVKTLDTSLTDLSKVTEMTNSEMDEFVEYSSKIGTSLAKTTSETIDATTEFVKAGYALSDATKLGEIGLMMTNVSNINNIEDATSSLIATLKGFNLEAKDSTMILDAMTNVANKTATDYSDLAEGIRRSGAILAQSGTSFQESLGLFVGSYEISRNFEKTSSGINMVSQRLRAVGEDGEKDMEMFAKLEDKMNRIANVDVTDKMTGQLRSTFDILSDLSKVWDTLSNNQQQLLATEIGGNRQAIIVQQLMSNWEGVDTAIKAANNSVGVAEDINKEVLDSVEGKLKAVKTQWELLANNTISSEFMKDVYGIASGVLELTNNMGGLVPILTSILGLVLLLKSQAIATALVGMVAPTSGLILAFKDFGIALVNIVPAMIGVTNGTTTMRTALAFTTPIIGAITIAIGLLGMAYANNQRRQEEMVRTAKQNQEQYQGELKTTNELLDSYTKLSKENKNTKDTREQLLNIQKQLVEQHGVEVRELDLLNKSYEENIDVINRAIEAKQRELDIDNDIVNNDLQGKLEKAMKTSISGSIYSMKGEGGIGEALRGLSEEVQNAFDLSNNGRAFKIKISPEIDAETAKRALDELLLKMEFLGQKGTTDYVNVANAYKTISDAMMELENHQTTVNENERRNLEMARQTQAVETAKSIGIQDVTKMTQQQAQALLTSMVAQDKNATSIQKATAISKEWQTILSKLCPDLEWFGDVTQDNNETTDDFATKLEKISSESEKAIESISLLNQSINSLQEGQTLTNETVVELLNAYPELRDEVELVDGVYTVSIGTLEKYRDQSITTFNDAIDIEIDACNTAIEGARLKCEAYDKEITKIKEVARAKSLLLAIESNNKVAMGYGGLTDAAMEDKLPAYKNALLDAEAKYREEKANINSLLAQLEALENKKQDFNILSNEGNTKKGSNISNKSSKSSDNPFQKEIDGIKQAREEIEREMSIIQSKLDLSETQGDSKAFDEYSNKMTLLLAKQKELADVEVGKFNALKGKYKKEEEQLTLNELIAESTKAKYTDEKEYLEQNISLIQRKTELEKQVYDDKLKQIELSQILMDENSTEYAKAEEEKVSMLLKSQSQYQDEIIKLKQLGLSNESTVVREYVSLWTDAEEKRLNIVKSMAEKRRQIEIDNLNTQKDQLQTQYDAKKSLLDMTIEMLKEEGKIKQQAVKDELSNMKKIADEKKNILKQEQADRKFNKEVDSANEEINSIQNDINKLMFDNSDWAIAERARLEKELKEKQVALDDKYYDDKIDKEINAIDEQVSLFEEQKNKELEVIEKTQLDEVALKKKALDMMDRNNKELYNKLKKYNSETLKMSQSEFDKTWESANKGLENFSINSKSTLEIMYDMATAMENLAKQAEILGKTPISYDTTINTPNTSVDKESNNNQNKELLNEQKYLHSLMVQAQKENNKQLIEWVKKRRKELGLNPNTGAITTRHNGILGGFAGNGMLPNEVLVKATTDEIVLNKGQQDILTKNIIGLKNRQSQLPPIQLNFNGTVTEGAKPLLREFKREIEDVVYKIVNNSL